MRVLASVCAASLLSLWANLPYDRSTDGTPPEAPQADADAERLAFLTEALQDYQVEIHEEGRVRPSQLVAAPALGGSRPVSGQREGIVGVWASVGRPDVVVHYAGNGPHWHYHFESTSLNPLTMQRQGRTVWSPRSAAIVLRPISGAPVPAETASERLAQMRELAGRFQIADDFHPAYVDEKIERHVLGLVDRPLYRYEPAGDLIDGALFGYVIAVDPEALLMIEACQTHDSAEWRYALASMTVVFALSARLDGREVWNSPDNRWQNFKNDEGCFLGRRAE